MDKYDCFRWSGHNWYIEDDTAWFIDAQSDALCRLNLLSGECSYVAQIPNIGSDKFMLNTKCIKIDNEIFCMPCYGDRIWIYNMVDATFQYIMIEKQNQYSIYSLYMEFCWIYDNKVFAVSRGLRQVIVVDINTKKIGYYPIDVRKNDTLLSCCVRVGTKIYCVSHKSNCIYQFDMDSKKTVTYIIPGVDENLALICFDGNRFWLSGYSKKIYVWDKDKNIVNIIKNFPEKFGNYIFGGDSEKRIDYELEQYDTQLFCRLEPVENYIWAIPYRTNLVLYIDKDTYEVHVLFIEDEEETKESLARPWKFKYFWQYLRDDRYIGIFSLRNNYILEIDTLELKEESRNYTLDDKYIKLIWNGKILHESRRGEKALFDRLIMMDETDGTRCVHQDEVGSKIYSHLK